MRDYFLQTERIGAREWLVSDRPFVELLWGNPIVTAFFAPKGGFTQAQIADRLAREIHNQQTYGYCYWPLFRKDSGDFIGCAGFRPYGKDESIVEFGIHLLPAAWGKGYAREVGTALIQYVLQDLGMKNIFAGHHPENYASKKMLEKLGFHYVKDEFYEPTSLYHPSYLYK